MNSIDRPTCVYHALHGNKTVSAHDAELLYKKGWRDSPDPKILYKGIRGKWYLLIVSFNSFIKRIAPHWDSHKLFMAFLALAAILVTLYIYIDSKDVVNNPKNIEHTNQ